MLDRIKKLENKVRLQE